MQPKLVKTTIAQYVPATWTGSNDSGVFPLGDKVLVLADQAADVTSGGVHIPQEVSYRHTLASEAGVVVALGDGAFKWNSDKMTPFEGKKPVPGDRVCMEKYSGQIVKGDDDKMYRLMESHCVGGILSKENK